MLAITSEVCVVADKEGRVLSLASKPTEDLTGRWELVY